MKIGRLVLLPLLLGACHQAFAAGACAALKSLQIADAHVTLAEDVTPNPEWKLPPSVFTGPAAAMLPGPRSTRIPFCRVALTLGKENHTEVWMPREWNGSFQGVGNGGYTGGINYPAMVFSMQHGFAVASTDTGHQTDGFFDTGWISGHPERVVDFGHRAHHQMAVVAKQVVAKFYAKPVRKSYFQGCSSGGWEALSEAQKYPEDYDGIIAGAPAINFTRLQSRQIMEWQASVKDPDGDVSAELGNLLVSAATAKCDASRRREGRRDRRSAQMRFQSGRARLQGKGPQQLPESRGAEACEVAVRPGQVAEGTEAVSRPGARRAALDAALPGLDPRHPADPAMALMLDPKPTWTVATFDPDREIPALEPRFAADLNAMNADLAKFKARGGKLILYHGWADQLLSPYNTLDYFEECECCDGRGGGHSGVRAPLHGARHGSLRRWTGPERCVRRRD